jgi:hypothetical protein
MCGRFHRTDDLRRIAAALGLTDVPRVLFVAILGRVGRLRAAPSPG